MNRAAFLDRDGVVIHDTGYPCDIATMRFIDGAPEAILWLNRRGWKVILVTNQSGVARGFFSVGQLQSYHAHMRSALFSHDGARIDDIYACLHKDDEHPDRKPNPGMLLRAEVEHQLDLSASFLVGDRETDMEAARRAGVPGYLFTGGHLAHFLRGLPPFIEPV